MPSYGGALVSAALTAFEEVERVSLLLERKKEALSVAVAQMAVNGSDDDRREYFVQSEAIRRRYEAKAAKAGLSG